MLCRAPVARAMTAGLLLLASSLPGCTTAPPPPAVEQPVPDKPLTIRGQLIGEGVECPALRGEDGTLYTLVGSLEGFKPGERVIVEGTPVAISFCMQGTTIRVTRITRRP